MATVESTLFSNYETNKYPADARDRDGRSLKRRIAHTVGTELNGDSVKVCKIRAGESVVAVRLTTDGLGALVTVAVGDVTVTNRYAVASALAAANDTIANVAFTGMNFRPTVDTEVLLLYGGANPTAGKKIEGWIEVIPGS